MTPRMKITCDSCGLEFETEDENWKAFINEAKKEGWMFVKEGDDWYRYCCWDCKVESEE